LTEYEVKKTPDEKIIKLARQFLEKIRPTLPEYQAYISQMDQSYGYCNR